MKTVTEKRYYVTTKFEKYGTYTFMARSKEHAREKFVGYADITIEAETEEEAIALYNRGHYPDSQYDIDDMFYDYQFNSIREEK